MAAKKLRRVTAPTLLTVGSRDNVVLRLNQAVLAELPSEKRLEIVEGAMHLFQQSGTLEQVAELAKEWLLTW